MKKKFNVSGISLAEQGGMKGEPGVREGGVYKPAWIHSSLQSCVEEHVQKSVQTRARTHTTFSVEIMMKYEN